MRYYYEPEKFTFFIGEKTNRMIIPEFLTPEHSFLHACTLYCDGNKGLGIVKQECDDILNTEHGAIEVVGISTSWEPIDDYNLLEAIYRNNNFPKIFNEWAKEQDEKRLYPITTVRKLMWALRMKPLPKERWETTFDRRFI